TGVVSRQATTIKETIECQRIFGFMGFYLSGSESSAPQIQRRFFLHATSTRRFRNAQNLCSLTEKQVLFKGKTEEWPVACDAADNRPGCPKRIGTSLAAADIYFFNESDAIDFVQGRNSGKNF